MSDETETLAPKYTETENLFLSVFNELLFNPMFNVEFQQMVPLDLVRLKVSQKGSDREPLNVYLTDAKSGNDKLWWEVNPGFKGQPPYRFALTKTDEMLKHLKERLEV